MMRCRLVLALLAITPTPVLAGCDVATIEAALEAPLAAMKPVEMDVSEVQSTEGGSWQIYREKDGRLNTIIRGDYGESGNNEMRLSVVSRNAYGVSVTRTDYLRHAFIEDAGPNATARRSTAYYYFCDGIAYAPPATAAMLDIDAYQKEAVAAVKMMRDNADISKFTIGLKK